METQRQSRETLSQGSEIPHPRGSELKVTVLARTAITDQELREQVHVSPSFRGRTNSSFARSGEYLTEFAGRSCYQSFDNPSGRSTEEYIDNIINQKHYSVLEHASVTLYLEGVSRAFTHELIRHRHFSYSQLSQRYVDQTELDYVVPPLFEDDPELKKFFLSHLRWMKYDLETLQRMTEKRHPTLSKKQIREAVRYITPNAIETKIVVTGNLRAWLEFLPKRMSKHADAEMQEVATAIHEKLLELYPTVFKHS